MIGSLLMWLSLTEVVLNPRLEVVNEALLVQVVRENFFWVSVDEGS